MWAMVWNFLWFRVMKITKIGLFLLSYSKKGDILAPQCIAGPLYSIDIRRNKTTTTEETLISWGTWNRRQYEAIKRCRESALTRYPVMRELVKLKNKKTLKFLATGYTQPRGIPIASCNQFSTEAQIVIITSFTQTNFVSFKASNKYRP